jgi:hypothetical protein
LLVTDFGYADVTSVVWEKLDVIDGDTEYVTGDFKVPPPVEHQHISGAVTGEQLLANNLQANSDYQLALQLSRETEQSAATPPPPPAAAAGSATNKRQQREQNDIELAKQASLLEHRQRQQLLQACNIVDIPPEPSATAETTASSTSQTQQQLSLDSNNTGAAAPAPAADVPTVPKATPPTVAVGIPATNLSQEERDMMLAMQLQRQEEQQRLAAMSAGDDDDASRQLALTLQKQERARQQQYTSRPAPPPGRHPTAPGAKAGSGKDAGCIIS